MLSYIIHLRLGEATLKKTTNDTKRDDNDDSDFLPCLAMTGMSIL